MIVFALLGMTLIGFLIYEFAVTQFRLMATRISTELEIMREDIKAKKEIKRAKLAKKREGMDKDRHENVHIAKVKEKPEPKHEVKHVEPEVAKPIPMVEEEIEIIVEQPNEETE